MLRPGDRKLAPHTLPYVEAAKEISRALSANEPVARMRGMGESPDLIHEPGGDTVRRILHPTFPPFERQRRILPDQSWFAPGIAPESPVQFEIDSYQVPAGMALWLFDYEFSIYNQSGIDPFDVVPATPGRYGGQMGFDITVGINKRASQLFYQNVPVPAPVEKLANVGTPSAGPPQSVFDSAQSANVGGFGSQGNSLLPVRAHVQGPRNGVFTIVARESEVVSLSCLIFRALTAPLAFIQGDFSGYLVSQPWSDVIIERMRPK